MKTRNTKPTLIVNESGKRQHPLVFLAARMATKDIAKLLGHSTHATVSIYTGRARKAPTMKIPAEWVLPLARALRVAPASLRPDLYLPEWGVDTSN
jgi:hypothetical protein